MIRGIVLAVFMTFAPAMVTAQSYDAQGNPVADDSQDQPPAFDSYSRYGEPGPTATWDDNLGPYGSYRLYDQSGRSLGTVEQNQTTGDWRFIDPQGYIGPTVSPQAQP